MDDEIADPPELASWKAVAVLTVNFFKGIPIPNVGTV